MRRRASIMEPVDTGLMKSKWQEIVSKERREVGMS